MAQGAVLSPVHMCDAVCVYVCVWTGGY